VAGAFVAVLAVDHHRRDEHLFPNPARCIQTGNTVDDVATQEPVAAGVPGRTRGTVRGAQEGVEDDDLMALVVLGEQIGDVGADEPGPTGSRCSHLPSARVLSRGGAGSAAHVRDRHN